jgi:hypothetical protein
MGGGSRREQCGWLRGLPTHFLGQEGGGWVVDGWWKLTQVT